MEKKHIIFIVFMLFAAKFAAAQGLIIDNASIDALPIYPESQGNGGKAGITVVAKSLSSFMGTPMNQGATSSCVPHVLAKSIQIQMAMENNSTDIATIDKSSLNPFSIYNYLNQNSCKMGTRFDSVFNIAYTKGVCPQTIFPFIDCLVLPNENAQKEALNYRISSALSLFSTAETNDIYKITRIKQAIIAGLPVLIGAEVDSAFQGLSKNVGKYWRPNGKDPLVKHALLIIGFDDRRDGGTFEILNSWGTAWGNKGTCYVRYKDFIKCCFCASVVSYNAKTSPLNDNLQEANISMKGKVQFLHYSHWDEANEKPIFEPAKTLLKTNKTFFETEKSWGLGQQFQISTLNLKKGMCVYVFSLDAAGKTELHYPTQKNISSENTLGAKITVIQRQSALMPSDSIQLLLPSQDEALELDKIGQENICVLFSAEEIPDIHQLIQQIGSTSGLLEQRLKTILGNRIAPTSEIDFKDGSEITFSSESKVGYIVPIILKMEVK